MKKSKTLTVKILTFIFGVMLTLNGFYTIYKSFNRENNESTTKKNNVTFSINKITDTTIIGNNLTTDNNFIIVNVKIDNQGDKVYDVSSLRFKLLADGKEYEYCPDAILVMENAMYMDTINPGLSKVYNISYETPFLHTEKKCQLKILDNAFSKKHIIIDCD